MTRDKETPDTLRPIKAITLEDVVAAIVQGFQIDVDALFQTPRSRGQENLARSAALYVARKTAGHPPHRHC